MSRRSGNRRENKLILINGEGKYKTEKVYISALSNENNTISIHWVSSNSTDPVNIVSEMINKIEDFKKTNKYDAERDKAYCLIDTDYSGQKNNQIRKAIELAKKNDVKVILSNPKIELWFVLHFVLRLNSIDDKTINKILKENLENNKCEYKKGKDYYHVLKDKTNRAIENAKKIEQHQNINYNNNVFCVECNPYTNMYELVENLLNKEDV